MQILELDTIPREPGKLQELISDARRAARRHQMVLIASGLMVFVGMCMLLYTFVLSQPAGASSPDLYRVYLSVVTL